MIGRVARTIRYRALLADGDSALVACSGGPDSVALLYVMAQLSVRHGWRLEVAYVDHQLRQEAADEAALVAAHAERLGIVGHRLDGRLAPSRGSLQARARDVRYGLLRACAGVRSLRVIAVGHTMDDQAETVLARVLRGGGLRGLSGIEPRREDGVVRPLIDCRRFQVAQFIAKRGLSTVVDVSNADTRFQRVRIRRELLPRFVAEDPRAVEHLAALADEARELRFDPPTDEVMRPSTLRELPARDRAAAIARWLQRATGAPSTRRHLESVVRALNAGGEVLLRGGWRVRVDARRDAIEVVQGAAPLTRSRRVPT